MGLLEESGEKRKPTEKRESLTEFTRNLFREISARDFVPFRGLPHPG